MINSKPIANVSVKEYVIFNINPKRGHPPSVAHLTYEAACIEAKRLSSIQPDDTFIVCRVTDILKTKRYGIVLSLTEKELQMFPTDLIKQLSEPVRKKWESLQYGEEL